MKKKTGKVKNDGVAFERLVRVIKTALENDYTTKVTHHAELIDADGIKRQIDILVESSGIGASQILLAIECKDWAAPTKLEQLDAFVYKLIKLNISQGIMVSKTGFQSGAKKRAKKSQIPKIGLYRLSKLGIEEVKNWIGQAPFLQVGMRLRNHCVATIAFTNAEVHFSEEELNRSIVSGKGIEGCVSFWKYIWDVRAHCYNLSRDQLLEAGSKRYNIDPENNCLKFKCSSKHFLGQTIIQHGDKSNVIAELSLELQVEYFFETSSDLVPLEYIREGENNNDAIALQIKFNNSQIVMVKNCEVNRTRIFVVPLVKDEDAIETEILISTKYISGMP